MVSLVVAMEEESWIHLLDISVFVKAFVLFNGIIGYGEGKAEQSIMVQRAI